jgi:hypothetical protein
MGWNSQDGTCFSAAAWKTKSTPRIADASEFRLRTSPM